MLQLQHQLSNQSIHAQSFCQQKMSGRQPIQSSTEPFVGWRFHQHLGMLLELRILFYLGMLLRLRDGFLIGMLFRQVLFLQWQGHFWKSFKIHRKCWNCSEKGHCETALHNGRTLFTPSDVFDGSNSGHCEVLVRLLHGWLCMDALWSRTVLKIQKMHCAKSCRPFELFVNENCKL